MRPITRPHFGREYVESKGVDWQERKEKDMGIDCSISSLFPRTLSLVPGFVRTTRPTCYVPIGGRVIRSFVPTIVSIFLVMGHFVEPSWKNFYLLDYKKRYKWFNRKQK